MIIGIFIFVTKNDLNNVEKYIHVPLTDLKLSIYISCSSGYHVVFFRIMKCVMTIPQYIERSMFVMWRVVTLPPIFYI